MNKSSISTTSAEISPRDAAASSAVLDVVIVNWNSGDLLAGCLEALAASNIAPRLRVMVVDNDSHDASWRVADAMTGRLRVQLIRNESNRGFGAACNQGAAQGDAPFILFLNPDTRVRTDTLSRVLDFMDAPSDKPQPAIAGVRQVDDSGATQGSCATMPTAARMLGRAVALDKIAPWLVTPHFMPASAHMATRDVAQVMGAFLLIRRELFKQLGGFDERFFVYYEDLDLCVRAGEAGGRVVHFAGAEVWHQGQGTTAQVKDRRLFYFLRSETMFAAKHFGPATAWLLLGLILTIQIPLRTARAAVRGAPGEWRQALRGAAMLARDLPRFAPKLRRG